MIWSWDTESGQWANGGGHRAKDQFGHFDAFVFRRNGEIMMGTGWRLRVASYDASTPNGVAHPEQL